MKLTKEEFKKSLKQLTKKELESSRNKNYPYII